MYPYREALAFEVNNNQLKKLTVYRTLDKYLCQQLVSEADQS